MTLVAIPDGMIWPHGIMGAGQLFSMGTGVTMDALDEKCAMMGKLFLTTGPGTSKTLSAAGGGSISFRLGTTTFANGSTTIAIGLQDVAAGALTVPQPDGTFDVQRVLTGGGGGLTTGAWNIVSMTGGSDSKTVAHGDHLAVVCHMTARAGADSVIVTPGGFALGAWSRGTAAVSGFTSSWAIANGVPNVVITFDDGTLGYLRWGMPISAGLTTSFSNSTNPDENGLIFRVPFDCTLDGAYASISTNDSADDFTISVYETPLGTPNAILTGSFTGEHIAGSSNGPAILSATSQIALTKNTDYCVALKADSTGTIDLHGLTLGNEAYRSFWPAGTTMAKATRNNSTGAFTAESPAISHYQMGVMISQIHDSAGAAGGSKGKLVGLLS